MSDNAQVEALQKKLEEVYDQLSRHASRLMVVHRAGEIMAEKHDSRELCLELLPIIVDAVFSDSACVALSRDDELEILVTYGLSPDQEERLETSSVEGTLWSIASGRMEPLHVEEPNLDPEVVELKQSVEEEGEVFDSTFRVYVPLYIEGSFLGVMAIGPKVTGDLFVDEDLRFLVTLASQAAIALHNALLFEEKERRIEELSVLLRISKEITSTLDLDRVLSTIVNMIGSVIPNDRCVLALNRGEKLEIRALSGADKFDRKQAEEDPVNRLMSWVSYSGQEVNISSHEIDMAEGDEEARPQGADVFEEYFAEGEIRSFLAVPLKDDQGSLGVVAIERRKNDNFSWEDQELFQILANQTAVAIRNAELYKRLPRLGALQPVMARAQRAGAWWRRRGVRVLTWALPLLALYLFLPLPGRVKGDASTVPYQRMTLWASNEGVLREVYFEEGDQVERGEVIARLENESSQASLKAAQSEFDSAEREAERARANQDAYAYRLKSMEASKHREQIEFYRGEVDRLDIKAPQDGIVLTPHMRERIGDYLDRGDAVLELASLDRMRVEVRVPEADIDEVRVGQKVSFKTFAYPGRSFEGTIWKVGFLPDHGSESVSYSVTAIVENQDGYLRPGMSGQARIHVGVKPLRWILGRGFERSLRMKFWI